MQFDIKSEALLNLIEILVGTYLEHDLAPNQAHTPSMQLPPPRRVLRGARYEPWLIPIRELQLV